MDDETYPLYIAQATREAFVLCLALGTLEAMRGGSWPLEAGIWTLARPVFWEALTELDETVMAVLQSTDELNALAELAGYPAAEAELDRMIAIVRSRLTALPNKDWLARWSEGPIVWSVEG